MKRFYKGLFASLTAIVLSIGMGVKQNASFECAHAEEVYEFIDKSNALDFTTTEFNATASFAVDNYAVQEEDYLALDLEGYVQGDICFKLGLNGSLIEYGSDVQLPVQSRFDGWLSRFLYGRWLFTTGGRGVAYIKLNDYFASVTNIETLDILFSDNKLESFTIHNVFISKNTTSLDGECLLNIFDDSGHLIDANVTNVSGVSIIARESAKGFQTNKSLTGGVVITSPKTHIEVSLDDIEVSSGYLAYDISFNGQWVYFRTALYNKAGTTFSASYFEHGKSLSKHGVLYYDKLGTEFEWFHCGYNVTGTVLERIHTATGELDKLLIDCDNLVEGSQLVLSNFYFISEDQKVVTPLVDFMTMSDEEFASKVTVTVEDVSASVLRAPKEMKIYYLTDSVSEGAKVITDTYEFDLNPVMRNEKQVSIDGYLLFESTIDYIAHVPWEIIYIDDTEVHNGTMENNEVIVKGETSFSTTYQYEKIASALEFFDDLALDVDFDENDYEDLLSLKEIIDGLDEDARALILSCSLYESLFDLSSKALVTLSSDSFIQTGKEIKPDVTVKLGDHELENDVDYSLNYLNNIYPGEASVTVSFKGLFSGEITKNFTITKNEELTFVITFNPNGGTGTMPNVNHRGNYTLPECKFVAPEGKEFDCWLIDGSRKKPGDTINVDKDIEVLASWKTIQNEPAKAKQNYAGLIIIVSCVSVTVIALTIVGIVIIRKQKAKKKSEN